MTIDAGLAELAPVAAYAVLLELAGGTLLVAVLLDWLAGVPRGFVGTTALICGVMVALDLLIGANLPPLRLAGQRAPVPGGVPLGWAVTLLALLAVLAVLSAVGTDVARRVAALAAAATAMLCLLQLASFLGPPLGGAAAAAMVFLPAALLAGAATAGMLLGHWYLVAPSLSFRPLRLAVQLIFAAVAVQAVQVSAAVATSTGRGRDQLLGSSLAVMLWLMVVGSGVVLTTGVNALTLYFARIRANQPATAMLYVLIVTVLIGLVPAHLLFLRTAVPV